MRCNGYEVIDMGVMVPAEEIIDTAVREHADYIGLSGLITPSLEEMCNVARLMNERGLSIPILVGGATASAVHTAVKIAPCYDHIVAYTRDAAVMPSIMQEIASDPAEAERRIKAEQESQRSAYAESQKPLLPLEEARRRAFMPDWEAYDTPVPSAIGATDVEITVEEAIEYINWRAFFPVWQLEASFAELAEIHGCDHCRAQWLAGQKQDRRKKASEAMQLLKEAQVALARLVRDVNNSIRARVVLLPANSAGDNIIFHAEGGDVVLPLLRQQKDGEECLSLSDFVKPCGTDYVGAFAVTAGRGIEEIISGYQQTDDFKALLYQSLSDRLAEAAAELLHARVRREVWGYAPDERIDRQRALRAQYRGIRPAAGYPSLPDQSAILSSKNRWLHECRNRCDAKWSYESGIERERIDDCASRVALFYDWRHCARPTPRLCRAVWHNRGGIEQMASEMMILPEVAELLEAEARRINAPEFVAADPVQFPRQFSALPDIEIAAFLSATIAWGNRKMICSNCNKMLRLMDFQPYRYVMDCGYDDLGERFNIHRTFFSDDLHTIYAGCVASMTAIRRSMHLPQPTGWATASILRGNLSD